MLLCKHSFGEEIVVELCIGIGQEHLEGVLKPSETEAVLRFICKSKNDSCNVQPKCVHCLSG